MPSSLPQGRRFNHWFVVPPRRSKVDTETWAEPASIPLVRELLRRHAEISSYGSRRLAGNRAQRNASWYHYRNFLRQGMSNFDAATQVSNRSACLLYYYALLNFAKAELLRLHANQVVDTRIYHGLTFDVTRARTIAGDRLRVNNGVFRLLYEQRVGHKIAVGQILPIKRILANIPEIATQMTDSGIGKSAMFPIYHLIATDGQTSWSVILAFGYNINPASSTGKLFLRNFREIQPFFDWQSRFALSSRAGGGGRSSLWKRFKTPHPCRQILKRLAI